MAQTHLTLAALRAAWPGGSFDVREIKTTGDKRQDLSLTHLAPGGHGYVASATVDGSAAVSSPPMVGRVDPGLFTKELEAELLAGTIDVAVHSLKDLPTVMPEGLALIAVLPRANTEDVLIWKRSEAVLPPGATRFERGVAAVPAGAMIATSSLRRQRQLLHARPDLRVCEVRGNVETRLRKLDERDDWMGLILARAGLERLGYGSQLRAGFLERADDLRFALDVLGPEVMLPAVGQGAIGLQVRTDDAATLRALAPVNHAPTWTAVTAERELLRLLGGGCQLPLGVATSIDLARGELGLRAVLFTMETGEPPRFADVAGPVDAPETVAALCVRELGEH